MECAEHSKLLPMQSVILYSETQSRLSGDRSLKLLYNQEQEHQLLLSLKNGSQSDAERILETVFSHLREDGQLHPLTRKVVFQNLLCTFIKALEGVGSGDGDLMQEVSGLFDQDIRFYASERTEAQFAALAGGICRCLLQNSQRQLRSLVDQINAYVSDHLSDPSLGVSGIADEFSIGVSYLSGFYSREAGIGLHRYITQRRVEEAQSLLLTSPDLTLDEIAARTGFTNTRTFSRAFQAEAGCSPGKYRSNHVDT